MRAVPFDAAAWHMEMAISVSHLEMVTGMEPSTEQPQEIRNLHEDTIHKKNKQ